MDKKKKVAVKHSESIINEPVKPEPPAMVTQVVEEIIPDAITEDSDGEIDTTTAVSQPETEPPADKSKEVVEELFSKPGAVGVTEISIDRKKTVKPLFWWAVVVIVAAVTTGISLIFFTTKFSPAALISAKPTPTPTAKPTPTQAPAAKKEDIRIQVLNGGGVPGAASKMKNFLVEKGYQVTDVGNTEEYSYESTEIDVKTGMEATAEMIKSDLKDEYSVGKTGTTLASDADYDARVTVGKE